MIRKKVNNYIAVENVIEEREVEIILLFTLKSVNLYESNTSRDFWKDLEEVFKKFNSLHKIENETKESEAQEIGQDDLTIFPSMLKFLNNLVPCLYLEAKDSNVIQNQATFEKAKDSLWVTEVSDMDTLMLVIQDIMKSNVKNKKNMGK